MNFQTFHIVVGNSECNAKCPFCISGNKFNYLPKSEIDDRNLLIGLNIANKSNVNNIVITSKGEPLLNVDDISLVMKTIRTSDYNSFVELQTNAVLYDKIEKRKWFEWYDGGLTHLAISVVSSKEEINQKIYTPNGNYPNLKEMVDFFHHIGFSVRLVQICCQEFLYNDSIMDTIDFCIDNEVEQLTFRNLNNEFDNEQVENYIKENKIKDFENYVLSKMNPTLTTKLLEIERVGVVYDYAGQNVMISGEIGRDIRSESLEKGRSLIFENNHLYYEWERKGAILL